jgi:hypothetical protein
LSRTAKQDALSKAERLITRIKAMISNSAKPYQNFIQHILILYMVLRGKYTFINMFRYEKYNEKPYHNQMKKQFDWDRFDTELVLKGCSYQIIFAYPPSYLSKSGKKTPNLGFFRIGTAQKVKRGIEFVSLAIFDIVNQTAFSLKSAQTPLISKSSNLEENAIDHHLKVISPSKQQDARLNIKHLAVNWYFAKVRFVNGIRVETDLHVISKFRPEANPRYAYSGSKYGTTGHPKSYDSKGYTHCIERRRIRYRFDQTEDTYTFSSIAFSTRLKRRIPIYITDVIFSKLALDQNGKKFKDLYEKCSSICRLVA